MPTIRTAAITTSMLLIVCCPGRPYDLAAFRPSAHETTCPHAQRQRASWLCCSSFICHEAASFPFALLGLRDGQYAFCKTAVLVHLQTVGIVLSCSSLCYNSFACTLYRRALLRTRIAAPSSINLRPQANPGGASLPCPALSGCRRLPPFAAAPGWHRRDNTPRTAQKKEPA